MKKYKVWAYNGLAWLDDLGTFDSFDEAQDALLKAENKYCGDYDSESYELNHEAFWFNSIITEETT